MEDFIRDAVCEFANEMKKLFGDRLGRIVVYGSYARGDYNEWADHLPYYRSVRDEGVDFKRLGLLFVK